MNTQKIDVIQEKIRKAMSQIEKEFDVKLEFGGTRYSDTYVKFQLIFAEISNDGIAESPMVRDFKSNARICGLKPDDLGKKFKDDYNRYHTIIGLKPRSYKRPIITECEGKKYKWSATMVAARLANQ